MERLLFVKKFTLYFRRLNFFLWSIVIVLLLQQVHCQKPPVYTAESCSNESVFWFFSTKSEQTAIQQSHIINPLLTSFARSVRESIAFGFYRTDLAPSSLGLYENLRQYFPVQTSHSVIYIYGHDSFNAGQQEAINSTLHGQDTVALIPTGGGKSLSVVYTLPAIINQGLTVVIEPLKFIMEEQAEKLRQRQIAAFFYNSSLTDKEMETPN